MRMSMSFLLLSLFLWGCEDERIIETEYAIELHEFINYEENITPNTIYSIFGYSIQREDLFNILSLSYVSVADDEVLDCITESLHISNVNVSVFQGVTSEFDEILIIDNFVFASEEGHALCGSGSIVEWDPDFILEFHPSL